MVIAAVAIQGLYHEALAIVPPDDFTDVHSSFLLGLENYAKMGSLVEVSMKLHSEGKDDEALRELRESLWFLEQGSNNLRYSIQLMEEISEQ